MIPQYLRGPNAELCAAFGLNPVAHGNHNVQIVKANRPAHGTSAFLLNYRGFLGSCLLIQLLFLKGITNMKANTVCILAEQKSHLLLAEPDCFLLQLYIEED